MIFSYWGFIDQLEVGGESCKFSKVDIESVTILIALRFTNYVDLKINVSWGKTVLKVLDSSSTGPTEDLMMEGATAVLIRTRLTETIQSCNLYSQYLLN